jgi:hypothetical protein
VDAPIRRDVLHADPAVPIEVGIDANVHMSAMILVVVPGEVEVETNRTACHRLAFLSESRAGGSQRKQSHQQE